MGIQIPMGMDNFSVGVPPVILTTYFTHHIGVLKRATECAAMADYGKASDVSIHTHYAYF